MPEVQKLPRSKLKAEKLRLLKEQNWECAICGINLLDRGSDACLDHCHNSGFLRGVLCRNCNRGEGKVRTVSIQCKRGGTQLDWVMQLVKYLITHKAPNTHLLHPTHKTDEDKRVRRNKLAKKRRDEKKNDTE